MKVIFGNIYRFGDDSWEGYFWKYLILALAPECAMCMSIVAYVVQFLQCDRRAILFVVTLVNCWDDVLFYVQLI